MPVNGTRKEANMPIVNGKHFAYTKVGRRAAARAKKGKNYSKDAIKMARKMYG